jgi:hypothetical protein
MQGLIWDIILELTQGGTEENYEKYSNSVPPKVKAAVLSSQP